jgi:hypothetical protein
MWLARALPPQMIDGGRRNSGVGGDVDGMPAGKQGRVMRVIGSNFAAPCQRCGQALGFC